MGAAWVTNLLRSPKHPPLLPTELGQFVCVCVSSPFCFPFYLFIFLVKIFRLNQTRRRGGGALRIVRAVNLLPSPRVAHRGEWRRGFEIAFDVLARPCAYRPDRQLWPKINPKSIDLEWSKNTGTREMLEAFSFERWLEKGCRRGGGGRRG